MGAFLALRNYYDVPLHMRAQQLGYHESNIYILLGDEQGLKLNCPDIYRNLIICNHNRDNRTIVQYGQDMVASWIFEDDLIAGLQDAGLTISHRAYGWKPAYSFDLTQYRLKKFNYEAIVDDIVAKF